MNKKRFITAILITCILVTSCSIVDKLKEKLGTKETGDKKEETAKEETKEVSSAADLEFYNKYIEVSNKVQDAGEKVYKDYMTSIPEPNSIRKNDFIIAVSFKLSTDKLERVYKEYNRSMFDGGELSKLNASEDMKNEIEGNFKDVLKSMQELYNTSVKVGEYYSSSEYKNDLSKAVVYDEEIKASYGRYKAAFDMFTASVKKHKPRRKHRDIESINNPDEKAVAILMNSYEKTLDAAEEFYDEYNGLEFKAEQQKAKEKFRQFEDTFTKEKDIVMSAEFSDKTKYMKYSYEDYFSKMCKMFMDAGNKFFDKSPNAKDEKEYNRLYDDVVNNYNYMINAYNTNINIVNSFRVY